MITKEDCQEFTSYGAQSKKNLINMYLWAAVVDMKLKITLLLLGGLSTMLCMKLKKYRRINMRELNKDFKRCFPLRHKNRKYRRRLLKKAAKMIHVDLSSYFTNQIFCKLKGANPFE